MKKCSVGGQAVMEGVMMKAPGGIAMAVRDAKGRIILDYKEYQTKAQKGTFYGLPIVRGVVAFVESLTIGMNTLTRSAELIGDPIDEEPTKFEKWLSEKLGKSVEKVVMGLAVILAVALSVGLFFLLPHKQPYIPRQRRRLRHKVPGGGACAAMHFYRLHTLLRKREGYKAGFHVPRGGA
jgi:uncharacterized protein YqhQ